jgi:hypothetical protein
MSFTKTLMLLLTLAFAHLSFAAVTPGTVIDPAPAIEKIKAKDIEQLTGKKLTLLQKLQLKIVQNKLARKTLKLGDEPMTPQQYKQAKWSLNLGIASIAFLFVPVLGLLALPAAILAIIFGAKSLKGNSNSKGITGIVLGGLTVLLFLVAIIIIAAFLASWR